MAFTVLNIPALDRFARKHRDSRKPLLGWLDTMQRAAWRNLAELRRVYPSADGISIPVSGGGVIVATVFNIKGNRYRLITIIHYGQAICRIVEVLTHAEYSTHRWKERI